MRHRVLGATIFFVAFLLFAVKADDSEGDVSNPEVFTESDLVIVGKVVAIHENQKALRVVPRRSPQIVVYEVRRVLRGRCSLERIVVHRGLAAEMKTGDLHVLALRLRPVAGDAVRDLHAYRFVGAPALPVPASTANVKAVEKLLEPRRGD